MGTRIMVSLLLTVCACVFSILSTDAAYGDWWANNRAPDGWAPDWSRWDNNRAPCTEPPCPPECPWPEDCRRNRGPQYGDWWANNRGPSHQYGHYGSFLGMGRPQFPQFGARPQYPQFGARPQYPQFGARPMPQLPQYGPQLPQYGNYGPQLPQYGNHGGLWGGNKAARPPRWWGQGPGTNIQIGK